MADGAEGAWDYSRGHPNVIVAFIDGGADVRHPDLHDSYMVNPHQGVDQEEWEDRNGNGRADFCTWDPLYPDTSGDLDGEDNDGNEGIDDVLLGYKILPGPPPRLWQANWRIVGSWHGTAVAGILGARTANGLGIASLAGGSFPKPGVRLIQFALDQNQLNSDAWITAIYYAHTYGASIFSSSVCWETVEGDSLPGVLRELASSMLFFQGAGNNDDTPLRCAMGRLPGVIAVGGYDCISGGRWIIPHDNGDCYRSGTMSGSDYGPELSLLGPTDDELIHQCQQPPSDYPRMVMTSTNKSGLPIDCEAIPEEADEDSCFGGTSAATPAAASVAALVLSYMVEHSMPPQNASAVRRILEHTAEDVLCDAAAGCPCPGACVDLLGWDMFSGYGRVDAGRALTLPIAILDPLEMPLGEDYPDIVIRGQIVHISWETTDINTENGLMDPMSADARYELHYLVPEYGFEWRLIDDDIPADATSYDWLVPADAPVGRDRRIRLTVVDSGTATLPPHRNEDYSERFWILGSLAEVPSTDPRKIVLDAIRPNPSSRQVTIDYSVTSSCAARFEVLDVGGRNVRSWKSEVRGAGRWSVTWDGKDQAGSAVPSELYIVRVLDCGGTRTGRIAILR